jgi:SAM-dependent methyltransferase
MKTSSATSATAAYVVGGLTAAAALYYVAFPRKALKAQAPPAIVPGAAVVPLTEEEQQLKVRIKAHYDGCSPHYQSLWGKHIHHGLWRPGNEHLSKEVAQELLVDELYAHAHLPKGAKVLDVGCGVGGTSCKLAALGHDVTGVSLSTTQVQMAKENMEKEKKDHLKMMAQANDQMPKGSLENYHIQKQAKVERFEEEEKKDGLT